MGRFRAEAVIVRKLPEVTIIFWDKESIYVYPIGGGGGTIFTRWADKKGSYSDYWHDFRVRMLQRKRLSFLQCYELAAEYDQILAIHTDRQLDLSKVKVEYRS